MTQLRRRLTYANVMSTLAVFLVLGGATAFAVSGALPKQSVGTKQLKPGAVTTKKLRKGAVSGKKLRNGAVTAAKLRRGAVSTRKLRKDAVTGAKIDEATLAAVPSAASAASAANAATAEGPIAFAHVSAAGALLDGRGVTITPGNLTGAGKPAYYCFSGIPFAPRGLVATPDYRNETLHFDSMLQVALESSGGLGGTGCPAGTQAYVHGVGPGDNTHIEVAFYVVFFR